MACSTAKPGVKPSILLKTGTRAACCSTSQSTPTFSGTSQGMTPAMIIISTAPTPLPVW
jgi:hypothetical protein